MAKKNKNLELDIDSQQEQNLPLENDLEFSDDQGDEGLIVESLESDAAIFLTEGEEEAGGFLPEALEEENKMNSAETTDSGFSAEGTELDAFESAQIEDVEFVEEERLESIIESVLFASDRPVSLASLKMLFTGTNIPGDKIRRALEQLSVEYAGGRRGVTLEEVPGGYQLRTKIDNLEFLKRTLKTRQFKLSGPALEVLSIVAYKQPIVKSEVDEIRGVESGHLLRALMEKNLVTFEGKSDLPGRPMQYGTTKKFLEIFGLRNLKELPTLSQIDELLPDGIDEQLAQEKPTLASITDSLSENMSSVSYSSGEDELTKIQEQLEEISTSSTFFEEEKRRQAEKRDHERAQNIREALAMGEAVSNRDGNWLKKFDEALAAGTTLVAIREGELAAKKLQFTKSTETSEQTSAEAGDSVIEMMSETTQLNEQLEVFDHDEDLEIASHGQLSDHEVDEDEELPFYADAEEVDEGGTVHS